MVKVYGYCEHRIGEFCNTVYKTNDILVYPKIILEKEFKFYRVCPLCGFRLNKEDYIRNAKIYLDVRLKDEK